MRCRMIALVLDGDAAAVAACYSGAASFLKGSFYLLTKRTVMNTEIICKQLKIPIMIPII